jgi:hypothetical protein
LTVNAEYSWESTSANAIELTFPNALTDTPGDEWYRLRLKCFIASPDAVVQLFGNVKLTWAQILESLRPG